MSKKKKIRKVKQIIDGDTLRVASPVSGSDVIRIANTDAPEKGQKGNQKAKKHLKKLKDEYVSIEPVGKSYGRTVAKVKHKGKPVKAKPEKTKSQKKSTSKRTTRRKSK